MIIRLEIDFHPPDDAFEEVWQGPRGSRGCGPEGDGSAGVDARRMLWLRNMIQRAFPYLDGAWFDVTVLDAEAPHSAEPAVAVHEEALTCDARAFGRCIKLGAHALHRNGAGTHWSPAVEAKHPFGDGDGTATLRGQR